MASRTMGHVVHAFQGTFITTTNNYFFLRSKTCFRNSLIASLHLNSCSSNDDKMDEYKQMCILFGLPVDNYSTSIAIKSYCEMYGTNAGRFTALGSCFKHGIAPSVSTYNTLLNGFILEAKTHKAEKLFNKLIKYRVCEPDVVTYNTMIKGLCKIGNNFTAIGLLRLMDGRGGCEPNVDTYKPIIDGLCNDIIMIDCLWGEVSSMLKRMEGERISPDVITFSMLVDALCKQGKMKEAEVVFDIMVDSGGKYPPDMVTYNSLIDGYCLQSEMNKARAMFDSRVLRGVKPNLVTYNSLLNGYCMDNEIFKKDAVPKPNVITENIMYRVSRRFRDIRDGCNKPSDQSRQSEELTIKKWHYSFLLNNLCDASRLEAHSLFRFMDPANLNSNIKLYNFLIECAGKCGELDMARHLFHEVFLKNLQPDFKTYTVMISGLCRGGLLKDAIRLFLKMEKSCPPDTLLENSIIINDLFQGYLRNKPLDDVFMLYQEMEARHYRFTVSTVTLIMDIWVAGDPHNTLYRLIRAALPKECKDDPFLPRDYYAFCDEE